MKVQYLPAALQALDEIYLYTVEKFGMAQADTYVSGLFEACETLASKPKRTIPKEFEIDGFYSVYQRHFIYWRETQQGEVVVVCVLHQNRDLVERFYEALAINENI